MMKKYRMWIWIVLAILFVPLLLFIVTAIQVDDWNRDLSQNRAETSQDADDPRLRSLVVEGDLEAASQMVQSASNQLPGWNLSSVTSSADFREIQLTRTSRLFRFVDDVTLTIRPHAQGSMVDAVSQSRVGKGDLGQNPRNIEELFAAIKKTD